jgi:hypothetical protein
LDPFNPSSSHVGRTGVISAGPSWPLDCCLDVDNRYFELSDRGAQEVPLKPDGEDSHGHDQEDYATDDACD